MRVLSPSASAFLHPVFAALLFAAVHATAATVGPAGYTNGFSTQPPATDWATLNIAGGGGDTYDLDTDVNAVITASGVTAQPAENAGDPPPAGQIASWSSTGLYLQTRPSQNRYTVLVGKFVNNTGTNATQVRLSYVMTFSGPTAPEEKGTRVYYSLTGTANSWTNLPALNSTANTGSYSLSTNVLLNWTNGGTLYVLFADDNANSGTDEGCQYDNFLLRVTAGSPSGFVCRLNTPTNGAVFVSSTNIVIQASPVYGTPPYTVEYFTNAGAGNLTFASAGAVNAPPYTSFLGSMPAGIYNIFAVAMESAGIPVSTNSTTNVFSVADPISFVMSAPTNDAIFTNTSNVFGRATVAGGTAPYSVQFYLDNLPNGVAVISPPYQRNFGGLPVGDHTIRATVTDARGWVSNSLVHTVHITGPLAASLTPANGSVITFGTSLSLTGAVAGGEPPYAAEFYVNGQLAGALSSPPFTMSLGALPAGSYTCYVHATDSSVPIQEARSSTNRITILPPALRVMPLGDSITFGGGAAGGYRAPLYQLLTNAGHNVDFIGTQTGNGATSLPDPDHQGISGATIGYIDSILPSVFGAVVEPDIILLLLGVNDYRGGQADQATNRLEALVVRLATNWSNTKIIVGSLTAVIEPLNTQIQTTFNTFLPGICERQRELGRQVFFTDMHSAVPLADMPDQLHPNQLGYNKMATNWFTAVSLLLCQTCPPRFILHPKSQSMLPGTNVNLEASAVDGGAPIQYQWRFEGTEIPNATNATYAFTNASLIHQGNYTVTATDTNGTAVSSNAFLFLFVRPVFVLNPVPQTVLQGGAATFTALATGAPPIWYRWLSNGAAVLTNNTGVFALSNVQSNCTIRATATNFASGPTGVNMVPSTGVALTVLADFDQDGMADRWETNYPGLSTTNAADALLDFDGDGMSNRDEYITGTDPTNPGSVMKLTFATTNSALLEFVASSNITYSIQVGTNLVFGPWNNLTNLNAQSQSRTVQVNAVLLSPLRERYYRVVTPQVP